MKKLLVTTSALVAATAFAGVAQAADPIKLSLSGFGNVQVGYASNDDSYMDTVLGTGGAVANETTAVDVKGNNEVNFKGSTTLDNGLTISFKSELEAGGRSMSDPIDEYNIAVSGGFGTIVAGADDNALEVIAMLAPHKGGRLFDAGLSEGELISGTWVQQPAGISAPNASFVNTNDSESISFISQDIGGFTFGASYIPDATQGDDAPAQPLAVNTQDTYGAGAMWNGEFSGASVGVNAGYAWADASNESAASCSATVGAVTGAAVTTTCTPGAISTLDSTNMWQAGAKFGMAGFTVSGNYFSQNMDMTVVSGMQDTTNTAWEAGVGYDMGPYGVALSYFNSKAENQAGTSDDSIEAWQLTSQYAMGPGVLFGLGLGLVDFENGTTNPTVAQANAANNNGMVITSGIHLSF